MADESVSASSPVASSVNAEIDSMFEGVGSEPESIETASDTTEADAPSTTEVETPDSVIEAAAAEAEPVTEAAPPEPAETIADPLKDDGEQFEVRGQKWIKYPEARGKEVFAGYQASRELAKELGIDGPVTPEKIKSLAADNVLMDNLDFDSFSPNPTQQAKAFRYLFNTAGKAYANGNVAHNPHSTMAEAILTAASSAAPDVVAGLEHHFKAQIFDTLYAKAQALGIEEGQAGAKLLNAIQHADNTLNGNYRKRAELKGQAVDPMAARAADLQKREDSIKTQESQRAQAQWNGWMAGTHAEIESAAASSIAGILKPVEAFLKQFPDERKNLEIRLRQEIKDGLAADKRFASERERYYQQAEIAGNESVRDGWRARIKQSYAAKFDQILREKGTAIVSNSSRAVKAKSDETHKRLASTQQLRGAPSGGPAGSAPKMPANGKFTSESWAQEFDAAFQ